MLSTLDGPPRLPLHYDGPVGDPATLDDIPNPHSNQVTGPQLAVDCEIEQGKVPYMTAELKAYANRPDFIPLQRGFLTGDLSLVPGHAHKLFGRCVLH